MNRLRVELKGDDYCVMKGGECIASYSDKRWGTDEYDKSIAEQMALCFIDGYRDGYMDGHNEAPK